jgi:hypothetical protein
MFGKRLLPVVKAVTNAKTLSFWFFKMSPSGRAVDTPVPPQSFNLFHISEPRL